MDAGLLATVLLIAGLFLIALELMIPSFGIIGISAAVCLVISMWSAAQAWWGTSPTFFWTFTVFMVLGIPGVTGGMLFVLQTTPLGKRVVLQSPTLESVTPHSRVRDELAELIGERGSAASLLAPGGMVEVQGRRYHAESVGMMVDPDTPVEVVSVRGTRVVVRPVEESDTVPEETSNLPDPESSVVAKSALDEKSSPESSVAASENDKPQPQSDSGTDDDILDFKIPEEYTP